MKLRYPTNVGWKVFVSAITIIVSCALAPAYCQNQNSEVALLLQQTPNKGGTTSPMAGVYHFKVNSEVTLTAVPKQGYKFTYWMGDVSDQSAVSTVVYLDKPKVIVAIFEPTEYSVQSEQNTLSTSGGGGGGGLIATAPYISSGGGLNITTGSKNTTTVTVVSPTFPQGTQPIPEPATVILLTLGGIFVFAKRRPRKRHYSNQ